MRLIDLDKVRWKEGFYDMHTGEQFAPMMFNTDEWLEWATANAKVKAIPIEWIEKQIEKALSVDSVDLFYVGSLKHLIKEWEKENALDKQIDKWEIDDDVDWEMIQNGEITD